MFDRVPTGIYQDGTRAEQLIADKQGPKHCLIQGMTGSGKTDGEKPVILTCAARGAVQVVVDVRKKTQSYGGLAPVLDWLIVDDGLARAAMARLINNVIPARTEHLANRGLSSWTPDSGLQFYRFQVEEAWDFVDEDTLTEASLAARSAGIQLIISVQRASHDLLSTSLREQLGTIKCYGLKGSWGASILDDEVEDAGAKPQKWADEHPGKHYMQQGGLSLERKAMPIRAYTDSGRHKFNDVAKSLQRDVMACDHVTAAAWGNLYADRRTPMDLMKNVGTAKVTPLVGEALASATVTNPGMKIVQPDQEEENDVRHMDMETPAKLDDDGVTVRLDGGGSFKLDDADPEPGHLPDADEPIAERDPSRPSRRLGDGGSKVDRPIFDQAMNDRLEILLNEGRDLLKAADFANVVVATGWSRATVYNTLKTWVDAGKLSKIADGWIPVRQ